jgi:hypothetical protein
VSTGFLSKECQKLASAVKAGNTSIYDAIRKRMERSVNGVASNPLLGCNYDYTPTAVLLETAKRHAGVHHSVYSQVTTLQKRIAKMRVLLFSPKTTALKNLLRLAKTSIQKLDTLPQDSLVSLRPAIAVLSDWFKNITRKPVARRYSDVTKNLASYLYLKSPSSYWIVERNLTAAFPTFERLRQIKRKFYVHEVSAGDLRIPDPHQLPSRIVWLSEDQTALQKGLDYDRRSGRLVGLVYPVSLDLWKSFADRFGVEAIRSLLEKQRKEGQAYSLLPLLANCELAESIDVFLLLCRSHVSPLAFMPTDNVFDALQVAANWSKLRNRLSARGITVAGFVSDLDSKMQRAGCHLTYPFFIKKEADIPIMYDASFCLFALRAPKQSVSRSHSMPYSWHYDYDHAARVFHTVGKDPQNPMMFTPNISVSLLSLAELLEDSQLRGIINLADVNVHDSDQFKQRSDSALRIFSPRVLLALRDRLTGPSIEPATRDTFGSLFLYIAGCTSLLRPFLYTGILPFEVQCIFSGYGIYIFRLWRVNAILGGFRKQSNLNADMRLGAEALFHSVVLMPLLLSIFHHAEVASNADLMEFVLRNVSQEFVESLFGSARGYGSKMDARIDFTAHDFGTALRHLFQLADFKRNPEKYGLNVIQWAKKKGNHIRVAAQDTRHDVELMLSALGIDVGVLTGIADFNCYIQPGAYTGEDWLNQLSSQVAKFVNIGAQRAQIVCNDFIPEWSAALLKHQKSKKMRGSADLNAVSELVDIPGATWKYGAEEAKPTQKQFRASLAAARSESTSNVSTVLRSAALLPLPSIPNDVTTPKTLHPLFVTIGEEKVHLLPLLEEARRHVSDRQFLGGSNPERFARAFTDSYDDCFTLDSVILRVGSYIFCTPVVSKYPDGSNTLARLEGLDIRALIMGNLSNLRKSFPSRSNDLPRLMSQFCDSGFFAAKVTKLRRLLPKKKDTGIVHVRPHDQNGLWECHCRVIVAVAHTNNAAVDLGPEVVIHHDDLLFVSRERAWPTSWPEKEVRRVEKLLIARFITRLLDTGRRDFVFVDSESRLNLPYLSREDPTTVYVFTAVACNDPLIYQGVLFKRVEENESRTSATVLFRCEDPMKTYRVEFMDHMFEPITPTDQDMDEEHTAYVFLRMDADDLDNILGSDGGSSSVDDCDSDDVSFDAADCSDGSGKTFRSIDSPSMNETESEDSWYGTLTVEEDRLDNLTGISDIRTSEPGSFFYSVRLRSRPEADLFQSIVKVLDVDMLALQNAVAFFRSFPDHMCSQNASLRSVTLETFINIVRIIPFVGTAPAALPFIFVEELIVCLRHCIAKVSNSDLVVGITAALVRLRGFIMATYGKRSSDESHDGNGNPRFVLGAFVCSHPLLVDILMLALEVGNRFLHLSMADNSLALCEILWPERPDLRSAMLVPANFNVFVSAVAGVSGCAMDGLILLRNICSQPTGQELLSDFHGQFPETFENLCYRVAMEDRYNGSSSGSIRFAPLFQRLRLMLISLSPANGHLRS